MSCTDPVFIKDECHRFLFVNQAFCQLLGRSFSEIIGRSDYDFFPQNRQPCFGKKMS
uniref:PAS domain-containing protein n=1 Tax=Desertifilum tharense IPPAS B-1220 TaxID=1781255 RepID=A0ACD5GZV5_9CYAN